LFDRAAQPVATRSTPPPWIVKSTGVVNQFYFYCVDADFGPFFLKFCSYFPFNAKLCVNGHHWAQRQAAKAGIAFEAMDNAFAAVDDVPALQAICDQLGPEHIKAQLDKWLAIVPNPFTDDDAAAGFSYDISILQAEFSLTQMLDAPVAGRVFFEHVIRDNLGVGRSDQVSLIFDKRIHLGLKQATPGRFHTRVITDGVTPSLHVEYKHTAIKQYHKERKALRTETTINDTTDFAIGKNPVNLPALREIGFSANRRLLGVQALDHDPIAGTQKPAQPHRPRLHRRGRPHPRPAPRIPTQRRPARLAADVPTPTRRVHQRRPARHRRRTPRTATRHGHRRADDLRPGADSEPTDSSPKSTAPAATASPTTACTWPCSSPAPTTNSSPPAWPPARPRPRRAPARRRQRLPKRIDKLTANTGIAA
jgi:hypothetical protein